MAQFIGLVKTHSQLIRHEAQHTSIKMESHRLALVAGYRLEHYQIERILGKGGFGITYVAIDTHLGKRVAIKELLPDSIATRVEGSTVVPQTTSMEDSWAWAKDRFLEEARFLAGFSHPAIVGVHRLLEANGTAYMVMDYVEGESYEARLRRIGKEPDQASLMAVMGPIMEGIEELHAKNLLHRDIKPDNILIDKRGKPVLIDFGSARTSVGATMTMTSMVTHGYSPIEQYQTKGKMGPWTDIYAIGAVMCRAITGEKPPVAADRVIEDDFQWVSNRKPAGYDETFLNAVDWALRVRVEDRPQSVASFSEHLSVVRAATPPPIPSKIDPSPQPLAEEKTPIQKPVESKPNSNKPKLVAVFFVTLILSWAGYIAIDKNQSKIKDYENGLKYLNGEGVIKDESKAVDFFRNAAERGYAPAQYQLAECYWLSLGVAKDYKNHFELMMKWYRKSAEQGYAPAQAELASQYRLGIICAIDQVEAVKWARKSAEQGNAWGQYNLGECYYNGEGVSKDVVEAVNWYRKSAEQGNVEAQNALGVRYSRGEGVAKDVVEAVKWYRKSAEQGNTWAQNNLGECYYNGEGVSKDVVEAVNWYRKSAEQGNVEAQNALGVRYSGGEGVAKDVVEAVKWYRKSAEQGYAWAQYNLANCYYSGEGVAKDVVEAVKWCRKSAEQGNTWAQNNLGNYYYSGEGVAEDVVEAVKWYRKSAEQGYAWAQYNLGNCLYSGEGVSKDRVEAVKWYRESAEQGNAKAQGALGNLYDRGEGVAKDRVEAVKWYRKSAEQGNAVAQCNLGVCYYNGEGVAKDLVEAVKWYRKSAEQGNAWGQYNLGECYYNGEGVAKDRVEYVKWLRKSAEQGNAEAIEKLKKLK
jgi:TPR repeat protein